MPTPTGLPDLGIDPALLASPIPSQQALAPQYGATPAGQMDAVGAALQALAASGAPLGPDPTAYLSGPASDTNLEPLPPSLPGAAAGMAGAVGGAVQDLGGMAGQAAGQGMQVAASPQATPAPQPPMAPVQAATSFENEAYNASSDATRNAALAGHASQVDQAQRMAVPEEQYAAALDKANADYTVSRAALHAKADAETNAWMMEYTDLAQKEPNPGRWWDNLSGMGKALWGMSMLFSAANVALSPQAQNVALNLIMDNVQRDVQEQKDRLQRSLGALKMKGDIQQQRAARNLTDAADDHSRTLSRLLALRQAHIARAGVPGDPQKQAALAQADQLIAAQVAQLATSRREEAVRRDEAVLSRQHAQKLQGMAQWHASRMQEDAQAHDWGKQSREINKDYDLANLSAEAAKNKGGPKFGDYEGVPLHMGAVVIGKQHDPKGAMIQVNKENAVKLRQVFSVANKRADALRRLQEALHDGTFSSRFFHGDGELRSAVQELGYTTAKQMDPGGKITDQDLNSGIVVDLGYNPDGGMKEWMRFEQNQDAIKKMVDQRVRDLPKHVNNIANDYVDGNIMGPDAKIVWTPPSLHNVEPPAPNLTEVLGGAAPVAPLDTADFDAKVKKEQSDVQFRGRELPPYNKAGVQSYKMTLETNRPGPTKIRQLAEKALTDYAGDPWGEAKPGDYRTTKVAIESATEKAMKEAEAAVKELNNTAKSRGYVAGVSGKAPPTSEDVVTWAKRGNNPLLDAPEEIDAATKAALKAYEEGRKTFQKKGGGVDTGLGRLPQAKQ